MAASKSDNMYIQQLLTKTILMYYLFKGASALFRLCVQVVICYTDNKLIEFIFSLMKRKKADIRTHLLYFVEFY